MIISHKHKFIFVKTAKVAGTSLEMALREHLGEDDISTPVVSYDEEKAEENGYPGPKNFNKDYEIRAKTFCARGVYHEHSWAYEIRGILDREIWDEYFKFTIDRDPFDKSLSNYFHYRRPENRTIYTKTLSHIIKTVSRRELRRPAHVANTCNLKKWLEFDVKYEFSQNFYRYTVDNKVIVDRVYDFSKMDVMISELEKMIGGSLRLPHTKKGTNKKLVQSDEQHSLKKMFMNSKVAMKEKSVLAGNWVKDKPIIDYLHK